MYVCIDVYTGIPIPQKWTLLGLCYKNVNKIKKMSKLNTKEKI